MLISCIHTVLLYNVGRLIFVKKEIQKLMKVVRGHYWMGFPFSEVLEKNLKHDTNQTWIEKKNAWSIMSFWTHSYLFFF